MMTKKKNSLRVLRRKPGITKPPTFYCPYNAYTLTLDKLYEASDDSADYKCLKCGWIAWAKYVPEEKEKEGRNYKDGWTID